MAKKCTGEVAVCLCMQGIEMCTEEVEAMCLAPYGSARSIRVRKVVECVL